MTLGKSAYDLVRSEVRDTNNVFEVSDASYKARLLANESSLNPAFLLEQMIADSVKLEINRYWLPETSTPLKEELAAYVDMSPDQIMLGSGADELIQATLLTFLRPGDKVVMAWPAYPMYPYLAQVLGLIPIKVPLLSDFSLDGKAILETAEAEGAKLIIICNPSNPTGNLFAGDALKQILCHSNCMVAIDEAYYEFADRTMAAFIDKHDRLLIWRTFSKAFSLAGVRIGYLLGQSEVVAEISKVRLPFNLSNVSQWLALAALRNRRVFLKNVEQTARARQSVAYQLQQMPGVEVFPSVTNFLLFRTTWPARDVYEGLKARGVLVRQVEALSPLLTNCLRVSIGRPEENASFLQALRELSISREI